MQKLHFPRLLDADWPAQVIAARATDFNLSVTPRLSQALMAKMEVEQEGEARGRKQKGEEEGGWTWCLGTWWTLRSGRSWKVWWRK